MQFQNLQVNWQQLPQVETAELKPIEKNYFKVLYLSWGIFYLLILLVLISCLIFIKPAPGFFWKTAIIAAFLSIVVITFIIVANSTKRKAFAVREKDVLYRTGWIFQKLHIIPFNRVQHCVVKSGPIERKFNLATISIYTAASHVHDISISGLKPQDAEALKSYIIQQIQPLN